MIKVILGILSVLSLGAGLFFHFNVDDRHPNTCLMSYMYPRYIPCSLSSEISSSFPPYYSLFIYTDSNIRKETQWCAPTKTTGRFPVLFIPGNAGSHKQTRSVGTETIRRDDQKLFDFFTLDFDEEFSALSGEVLERQMNFTQKSIEFIQSLYSTPKPLTIIGHSMGGFIARALRTHSDFEPSTVANIITLNSPHVACPFPFDLKLNQIYTKTNALWQSRDWNGLILSINGGWRDTLVESKLGNLDFLHRNNSLSVYATGVPTSWCSADHQAITWCNQLMRVIGTSLVSSLTKSKNDYLPLEKRMKTFQMLFSSNLSQAIFEGNTHLSLSQTEIVCPHENKQSVDIPLNSDFFVYFKDIPHSQKEQIPTQKLKPLVIASGKGYFKNLLDGSFLLPNPFVPGNVHPFSYITSEELKAYTNLEYCWKGDSSFPFQTDFVSNQKTDLPLPSFISPETAFTIPKDQASIRIQVPHAHPIQLDIPEPAYVIQYSRSTREEIVEYGKTFYLNTRKAVNASEEMFDVILFRDGSLNQALEIKLSYDHIAVVANNLQHHLTVFPMLICTILILNLFIPYFGLNYIVINIGWWIVHRPILEGIPSDAPSWPIFAVESLICFGLIFFFSSLIDLIERISGAIRSTWLFLASTACCLFLPLFVKGLTFNTIFPLVVLSLFAHPQSKKLSHLILLESLYLLLICPAIIIFIQQWKRNPAIVINFQLPSEFELVPILILLHLILGFLPRPTFSLPKIIFLATSIFTIAFTFHFLEDLSFFNPKWAILTTMGLSLFVDSNVFWTFSEGAPDLKEEKEMKEKVE